VFDTPQDFYMELTNFQQQTTNNEINNDNIVFLTDGKNKRERTLADDFQGRF